MSRMFAFEQSYLLRAAYKLLFYNFMDEVTESGSHRADQGAKSNLPFAC